MHFPYRTSGPASCTCGIPPKKMNVKEQNYRENIFIRHRIIHCISAPLHSYNHPAANPRAGMCQASEPVFIDFSHQFLILVFHLHIRLKVFIDIISFHIEIND